MQTYTTIIKAIEMLEEGYSTREVRRLLCISSGALDTIKKRFRLLDISLDQLKRMPPDTIEKSFYQKTRIRDDTRPLPDFKTVYDRLNQNSGRANLYFLWIEYKKEHTDGYQYTQYKEYFNKWMSDNGLGQRFKMLVERKPGEIVYIDWVGDRLACVLDEDGCLAKAHFFITTVGVSSLIFVKAYRNEKTDSFIDGVVSALKAYRAVPRFLKPDNLKTAVTRHNKDELILNSAFRDLEHFYNTIVLPPPARKPTGKAAVESGVKYVETHILEKLRGHAFNSFDDLNEVIANIVYELNNRRKNKASKTRQELFDAFDRPEMHELPTDHFSVFDYAVRTVPNTYHLAYDDHYYSVPYRLIGQELVQKADGFNIYICDRSNRLIAHHKWVYGVYPRYITIQDHRPEDHQFYAEINSKDGAYFRNWAKVFGPHMADFIDRLLRSYEFEEQGYKSANVSLHMAKGYPKAIVDDAARECVQANIIKYTYFKKALQNRTSSSAADEESLPVHKNIRGKEEYR